MNRPHRFLPCVAVVATALWLGSLAHMLLSVATLFRAFPKVSSPIAVEAAPALFHVTERANLAFAAVAIVAAFLWHRRCNCRRLLWAIDLLLLASMLAVVQAFVISARMDALRLAGEGGGPAFGRLHGLSSLQYLTQGTVVLMALVSATVASRSPRSEQTDI